MSDKPRDMAHESATTTPISSEMENLPCHITGMLSHAIIASPYVDHCNIQVRLRSSTPRQRGLHSKIHVEECTLNDNADTRPMHHSSLLEMAHTSNASNLASYSYSHAPRTRFGNQQSDPRRRLQPQINYLDSLAARRLNDMLRNIAIKDKAIDLKCFGSLRNGFALPGAGLDLVMTTHGEVFPKDIEGTGPQILCKAFLDSGFDARITEKPRAPIVKLYEPPPQEHLNSHMVESRWRNNHHFSKQVTNLETLSLVGVQCDINFSGHLVIYNTELLHSYALCDERVRIVGVFVKMWAKARKINSPCHGTLCSYGYILMVIHYLMNVVDPPLYNIRFSKNETELRRACYNMAYGNRQPVGEMLCGFFAYYGSRCKITTSGAFNWTQDVISIPIKDPFEHNHNVGRNVSGKGLEAIRAEFSRAQAIICRIQDGRSGHSARIFIDKLFSLQTPCDECYVLQRIKSQVFPTV
ncbi:hypothetical protein BDV26DRAFT_281635 [Aspergillus bertholletiae]|uniref:Poly(A) RNA polymerase mitochondrial-like central palm domain-containing protein n=1 Tax=Aspergillus bertholletiae TaxID=1226010 RepID=A0A5N7B7F3_9EURO|nr:hypothetical protein BDV26DRAFT_281635 [Aspergillus bertholletiae]